MLIDPSFVVFAINHSQNFFIEDSQDRLIGVEIVHASALYNKTG